jgi:hypothetical protein
MGAMSRSVSAEELDGLSPEDPRALRSRRDLKRIHRVMRSVSILRGALARLRCTVPPRRIIELGSGDGSLLLRLARSVDPPWRDVELTLLDREPAIAPETLSGFDRLGWRAHVSCEDALTWADDGAHRAYDVCITTLFLHHFEQGSLRRLLAGIAARCQALVAIEPRRSRLAWYGSHLVGLLGANAVTRGDAVKSVEAGFRDQELSTVWPGCDGRWVTQEFAAWPFSHCFLAQRGAPRSPA